MPDYENMSAAEVAEELRSPKSAGNQVVRYAALLNRAAALLAEQPGEPSDEEIRAELRKNHCWSKIYEDVVVAHVRHFLALDRQPAQAMSEAEAMLVVERAWPKGALSLGKLIVADILRQAPAILATLRERADPLREAREALWNTSEWPMNREAFDYLFDAAVAAVQAQGNGDG